MSKLPAIIQSAELTFKEMAMIHGAVNWQQEASFAMQALKSNDYLAQIAAKKPDSLKEAIINVAAIGLSLNPVHARAYLVPMDNAVKLMISYRGFIYLALDTGSLDWVQAEVVCEKDDFRLHGHGQKPTHNFQPFGDRGSIVGVYVVAKTNKGDYLTTIMSTDEINAIKERTKGWKSGKNTPWKTDWAEMAKKTVIKRAYKTWPMIEQNDRLAQAIDISNQDEGIRDIEAAEQDVPEVIKEAEREVSQKEANGLIKGFRALNISEELLLKKIQRQSFDEMTQEEYEYLVKLGGELKQRPLSERLNEFGIENRAPKGA